MKKLSRSAAIQLGVILSGCAVILLGTFMIVNGLYHLIKHGEISFLSRLMIAPIIVFVGFLFLSQVLGSFRPEQAKRSRLWRFRR